MDKTVYQSERLYVKMDGKYRHVMSPEVFNKMGLDWNWKKRKFIRDEEILKNQGLPIEEWPEKEDPDPKQRNISILWMGDERWLDEFRGTHIVGFHEPCRPDWYPPSKLKLISYLKMDSFDDDRIRARVNEAKDHPNNGGYWLISGHEPDITGGDTNIPGTVEASIAKRIHQYELIRSLDSDAWNHPVVTFYDCTGKFSCYPGYEEAFTGEDHDVWIADIYANNKDGTVDYPGLEKAARLIEIGLSRSKGQFIPNLGACIGPDDKPASLVDQFEWWNKRFGPLKACCFWNSGIGTEFIGIYENEYLTKQAREVNHMLGLI